MFNVLKKHLLIYCVQPSKVVKGHTEASGLNNLTWLRGQILTLTQQQCAIRNDLHALSLALLDYKMKLSLIRLKNKIGWEDVEWQEMILKSHPNRMLAVSNWDRKSLWQLMGIYISRHCTADGGWGGRPGWCVAGKDAPGAVSTSRELPLWPGRQMCPLKQYKYSGRDFPGSPVFKTSPSNPRVASLIPSWGN